MKKPPIVPLAFAMVLTGCSAFKTSQTWQNVIDHRADRIATADGKSAYADRLHTVLAERNVEHKIVTYQFRYRTRLREEAVGAGTAVIYRDPATPKHPWWMIDENTAVPVWVPNGQPDRQLSFFLRRNAEVLGHTHFAPGDGKSFDAAPSVGAPVASSPYFAKRAASGARMIARGKSTGGRLEVVAAAPEHTAPAPSARPDIRFDALFRTTHGTPFDPRSSADRQKMVELQQSLQPRTGEI